VSSWWVEVLASGAQYREYTDVGVISVDNDEGDTINLFLEAYTGNQTLASYALNNCGGIRHLGDSTLGIYARIYGDLIGNIDTEHSEDTPIQWIEFWCAGSIADDVSITGVNIDWIRAHSIGGGVTIESVAGTDAKIRAVRTGYTNNERSGVTVPQGGWPTIGEMDIGTSGSPLTLITSSGVDITSYVTSMDDLFVDLDVGGRTAVLRNAPPSSETYNYSSGTPTHRMQLTGETATLGSVYATTANGGYLDTGSGDLFITSSTTDYGGAIEAVQGGSGANEVDLRGRFWFNAGIAAATSIRLSDDMDGELIFNAANNQRLWHEDSHVLIDGTNVTEESPAYSLVTTGGGTIGMVDGVGNDLGFHLHLEACLPASGSGGTNQIDRSEWKAGNEWIDLVFYGAIRQEGSDYQVALERYDSTYGIWIEGAVCVNDPPEDALLYDLDASGDNTSLNILRITACPSCPCTLPLGEYRIVAMEGGLKSDLGLQDDPDVQPFTYYFTLVE